MRIVLDTSILVRANDSATGLGRELLLALIRGEHRLILSNEVLHETARVLRYPRLRELHRLTEDGVYNYIGLLRSAAEIVPLDPAFTAPIRDINDLIVVQTAVLGEAEIRKRLVNRSF